MRKSVLALAAFASIALSTQASAATTVDVDGVANSSTDGSNAVSVVLTAGQYVLRFTQGAYTAFSRFSGTSGCDQMGANCATGFENSVRYVLDGVTFGFGDGNGNGGIGPLSPGNGYYATASQSFANSGGFSTMFNVATPTTAQFYLFDDNISDNRGGVSLSLQSAVPEPSTWLMLIFGFGLAGFAMRRSKQQAASVKYKFA